MIIGHCQSIGKFYLQLKKLVFCGVFCGIVFPAYAGGNLYFDLLPEDLFLKVIQSFPKENQNKLLTLQEKFQVSYANRLQQRIEEQTDYGPIPSEIRESGYTFEELLIPLFETIRNFDLFNGDSELEMKIQKMNWYLMFHLYQAYQARSQKEVDTLLSENESEMGHCIQTMTEVMQSLHKMEKSLTFQDRVRMNLSPAKIGFFGTLGALLLLANVPDSAAPQACSSLIGFLGLWFQGDQILAADEARVRNFKRVYIDPFMKQLPSAKSVVKVEEVD